MDKETYNLYKAHGICVKCGHRNVAPHRVLCEICLAKDAERKAKRRDSGGEEFRQKQREYQRHARERRKALGLCVDCGKPQAENSTCRCEECLKKHLKRAKKRYTKLHPIPASERYCYGLCYRCGEPVMPGQKSCPKCYELNKNIMLNNRRILYPSSGRDHTTVLYGYDRGVTRVTANKGSD